MAEKYPGDRAAYVAGLKAELQTLDRRPKDATRDRRIKEVEAELDRYSDEPKSKWRETASSGGSSSSSDDTKAPKPPKVSDVLAEVGDDKAKAQAALDVELARGDDARSTLVDPLKKLIAAE